MQKLQPCPTCGAQFDVSTFAPGTQFTCGACGAVVTAGVAAPPPRVPPPPSRLPPPGPSGAGRPGAVAGRVPPPVPSAGPRGPQYVPPKRVQEPTPAKTAPRGGAGRRGRAGRAEAEEEAPVRGGRRGAASRKGLSPVALAGIGGGVLVLAVVALMAMGKKDPEAAGGGGGASAPAGAGPVAPAMAEVPAGPKPDTLADIEAEWRKKALHTEAETKEFFKRYAALGAAGKERATAIAREIVEKVDPQFKPARELLGHKEFPYDVPEGISFRKYPYIRAVEDAYKQRWFEDEDAWNLAMKAWEKTKAHEKKLDADAGDPTFRALDTARKQIDQDKHFKDYNYEAIFASPYLICYSSSDRMSDEELATLPRRERQEKLAELEKSRAGFRRVLAEKARIFQQLYQEFLRRYGEACELKDLMAPFGGRPDYPPSKRSYRDGCPVIVWIFSDRKAFDDYHQNVVKNPIDPGVAGYFSPLTGWVYLYDEGRDREFEVNKNVHEGTHQLEFWFLKQKREWGRVLRPQSFFGEGFAEFMGAVAMDRDRKLTFHGVNRPRVDQYRGAREQLKAQNRKVPSFPVKDLVELEGYHNVRAYGQSKMGIPGDFALGLFYIQSWAIVHFLNNHENGKYQKNFTRFLDDMLNHPREDSDEYAGYTFRKFKEAMNIKSEDEWKRLDKEFQPYYTKLMDMDLSKLGGAPPARDDWPGYVPVDPVDPLRASAAPTEGVK